MTAPGRPSDATHLEVFGRPRPHAAVEVHRVEAGAEQRLGDHVRPRPGRQMTTMRRSRGSSSTRRLEIAHRDPHRLGRVAGVPFVGFADVEEVPAGLDHLVTVLGAHVLDVLGIHRRPSSADWPSECWMGGFRIFNGPSINRPSIGRTFPVLSLNSCAQCDRFHSR